MISQSHKGPLIGALFVLAYKRQPSRDSCSDALNSESLKLVTSHLTSPRHPKDKAPDIIMSRAKLSAERGGFEPPIRFPVCTPSKGLKIQYLQDSWSDDETILRHLSERERAENG